MEQVLAIIVSAIGSAVIVVQDNVYMDEIFHARQAQRYCRNDYTWDDKITTLPGLYLLSVPWANMVHPLLALLTLPPPLNQLQEYCSLHVLRILNWLLCIMTHSLLTRICRQLNQREPVLKATMLILLPTHFFFTFLYYTDVGSTLFVLAAYSLSLPSETGRRYPTLAAICAAVAVLFRQTNIIWAVFIAGDMVLRDRDFNVKAHPSLTDGFGFVGKVLSKVTILLQRYFAFISVGVAFAAFVFFNGGIVVGDKSNHVPMVHLSQLVYLMSFCGIPLMVCCIDSLSNLQQRVIKYFSMKYITTYLIMVVFCLVSLQYFRHVHPFLLADNRHYMFYLISKGARIHEWICLLVAPLHALLATVFASHLISARGSLWFTLYIACTALVLVPTPLVELRYFTLPFLIAYLNMDLHNNLHYYLVVYTFAVVNITTLYVFLYQPFTAPDGTVGRFMW